MSFTFLVRLWRDLRNRASALLTKEARRLILRAFCLNPYSEKTMELPELQILKSPSVSASADVTVPV